MGASVVICSAMAENACQPLTNPVLSANKTGRVCCWEELAQRNSRMIKIRSCIAFRRCVS